MGKEEMQLFRVTLKQGADNQNLLTISAVFDGKPISKSDLAAVTITKEVKTDQKVAVKTKNEPVVVKKDMTKVTETAPLVKNLPEKDKIKSETKVTKTDNTVPKSDTKISQAVNKTVISDANIQTPVGRNDVVVYRVQLLPSENQKRSKEFVLNGTSYKLYEYVYLGASRYAIGEFSKVSLAVALQRLCRQSGYPQSFVVAFKNNVRSLDPELFK